MDIVDIRLLSQSRWGDFEALFGPRGACAGCWCMYWKLRNKDFEQGQGDSNRLAQKAIVDRGIVPGLIAYVDNQPAGWIAVEERQNYPRLQTSRILKALDTQTVWSVTCFFVGKEYRGKGITIALLRAAIEYVITKGGKILEGYPVENTPGEKMPPVFIYTGTASAFYQAGFVEAARRSAKRPIMRYFIK